VTRPSPPANAPGGTLARLWREFTDPGPAGDTLNILKRYSDGILPGCMGLVFMGAGLGIASIFVFGRPQKNAYVPLIFGAIFALAGFGVFRMGLNTIASKARSGPDPDDADAS